MQAQADLDHTTIRAPVDGVVISRAVDVGQTVAASLQAPTLFTIAEDLTKMQVEVSVDEADIGRIKLDDRASFTVDSFPAQTFTGTVTQIRKAAQVVQNVVTYTVVVAVHNPGGRLLPGMTANVKMIVAEKPRVLKVPNAALRFRPASAVDAKAPLDAPSGPQAGGQGGQDFRNRIEQELKPSEAQRAQLNEIFSESRQKFARVREMTGDGNRRKEAERVRAETNARIAEILTAEQRPAWERLLAEAGSRGQATSGRVYVLENGEPKPLDVRLGLSDGVSTEVLAGLAENQEVITGTVDARAPAAPASGGLPRGRFF